MRSLGKWLSRVLSSKAYRPERSEFEFVPSHRDLGPRPGEISLAPLAVLMILVTTPYFLNEVYAEIQRAPATDRYRLGWLASSFGLGGASEACTSNTLL